jgi:hypothetical protein
MNRQRLAIGTFLAAVCLACTAQAQEPILLRYKLQKGDKAYFRSTSELKQTQSVMGNKLDNTSTQEDFSSRLVEDVNADGVAQLAIKTERLKAKSNFAQLGEVSFDSTSTERDKGSTLGAAVTPIYERLVGSQIQVFLRPTGEIKEVKGYTELLADLIKENPLRSQFAAGGSNQGGKMMLQGTYVIFSDKPVKPGDRWEIPQEIELEGLGKMKSKDTYTYVGPAQVGDRKTVQIAIATEASFELNITQGDAKVTGSLTSNNSSGTAHFDPEAGCLVSLKNSYTFSGQLNVAVNGMNIPIQTDQTHTITIERLEKLPE